MSWSVHYVSELKIISVTTSGVFTPEVNVEILKEILTKSAEFECNYVLIDHRKSEISFSFLEIHGLPALYDRFEVERKYKVAVVFKEVTRDDKFFQDVCRNRGFNYKVFDDYDAGLNWLLEL